MTDEPKRVRHIIDRVRHEGTARALAMVEPYPRTMSERDAILRRRVAQDELKFALADFEAGSK